LTNQEKAYVNQRLREDGVIARDDEKDRFSWVEVGRAFMLPQVILMAFVGFFAGKIVLLRTCDDPVLIAPPSYRYYDLCDGLVSLKKLTYHFASSING
jgi:hypothetical protein